MRELKKEYGNLCLTVRLGDSVMVGDILVTIMQVKNKQVRVSFNAPKNVEIKRTKAIDSKKE